MNAIIDIQGFKTEDNKFILKEIAFICNNRQQVFLIKQPYPFYDLSKMDRRQVSWIERNRRIYWSGGFITYSNHRSIVRELLGNKHIYTKGSEKVMWLKEIAGHNNVFNLEDKGCPSILTLYSDYKLSEDVFSCIYHSNICALKNVICLRKWCLENKILL